MSAPTYEHRFRVALHDTDAAGVLFFARLFHHAHDAYEAWMAQLGFPLDAMLRNGTLKLPIVHAEADYRRPMCHGDLITTRLDVADIGNSAFTIDYRFDTEAGEPAASARTVHAGLDAGGGRGLPEELRRALADGIRSARSAEPGCRHTPA